MVYRQAGAEQLDTDGADARLDAVFGALAHPARRTLLTELVRRDGSVAMNDLAQRAGISPQLLTKHAAALERAGLISREPQGRVKRVRAHPERLDAAQRWIAEMTTYWNGQLDALERYVATLRPAAEEPEGGPQR